MKRYQWVRLALRGLGVMLIGLSLPTCLMFLTEFLSLLGSLAMSGSPANSGWPMTYMIGWGLGGSAQFAFGLYLLLGGKRLRAWCMRDADRSCPRCDYESGPGVFVCPECGLELTADAAASRDGGTSMPPAASNADRPLPPK